MAEHRVELAAAPRLRIATAPALHVRAPSRARRSPRRCAAGTRAAAGRAGGSSPAGRPSRGRCPRSRRAASAGSSQRLAAPGLGAARIISRTARMRSGSKNMCSVRQRPMPSAPNARATLGVVRRVGVGAHLQAPGLVDPPISVSKSVVELGLDQRRAPSITSPVVPSSDDHVALRTTTSPLGVWTPEQPSRVVDLERAAAGDAALAHAARDHRRVRGHAAARGQDPSAAFMPLDVLGRRLARTRIDVLAALAAAASASSAVNTTLPTAAPGDAAQAGRDYVCARACGRRSGAAARRACPGSMRRTASSW